MSAAQPVLDVRGISKRFGGVRAVTDVSLRVMPGEIVSLIGPNGAGKTTTFNLVSGVLPPTEGTIEFLGRPTAGLKQSDFARAGIGRTFQNLALFRHGAVVGGQRRGVLPAPWAAAEPRPQTWPLPWRTAAP